MEDRGAKVCEGSMCGVVRFDGQVMTLPVFSGASREEREAAERTFPTPPTRGISSGRAILDRRIIHIHDVRAEPEYTATHIRQTLGYRTVLAVPLLREGDPIGALVMWRRDVRPFSQKQIDLMSTFANQAVIAIENVRLFTELESRNKELSEALERQTATGDILRVISQSPTDTQPVFDAIVERALRLSQATVGTVTIFDGELIHVVASNLGPDSPILRVFP